MPDEEKKEMPFITKALIVAILAVVIIILAAGISYFVASKAIKTSSTAQIEGGGKSKKDSKKDKDKNVSGPIVDFGGFTVNLNEKETRYLVCKIQFEIDPTGKDKGKNGQLEVPEKLVILQDRVLTILRSKSIMDLAQDPSLKNLKKEIINAVNKVLEKSKISGVYFTSWIIQ
ncbi:flagellar basal body-associated FliL family protein [Haliovirga abyssi]|uniref:Flagellar protein FliL n=1 Tax=Haliovirga abyssi TaxID=2996794 RepID=A0AAU9DHA6_9FUSO|nr:flagellar basal body-associated FliL family protein [Haliovirga abyssi]BDU50114.1 hypothetical protein HLVA_06830 [Haliovirga abyssi]